MTVMRNVGFTKRTMLGPRERDRECTEREVGREVRSLKTRQRKRPGTNRVASEEKTKKRLWKLESVPYPRKKTRSKISSMKTEWVMVGRVVMM